MGISKTHEAVDFSFFIIYVYLRNWFSILVASNAPFLALMIWKDLKLWANRDPVLSSTCIHKLELHTWYLSPRHIPLALFSKRVDNKTKCDIVKAMQNNLPTQVQIGKPKRHRVYEDSTLERFVSSEPWLFFQLLGVHPTFFVCTSCEECELNFSFL